MLHDASRFEFALQERERTTSVCPRSVEIRSPVSTFHTAMACPSASVVARRAPSCVHWTARTKPVIVFGEEDGTRLAVWTSHMYTELFQSDADTSIWPFGLQASDTTVA